MSVCVDEWTQIDEESTDVEIKSVDSSREKSTFMGSLGL